MGKPSKEALERCFQLHFSDLQLSQLARYANHLKDWSKRVRLISRGDLDHIWDRHILDCLNYAKILPETGRVLDFGSGAGLPGIIISICRPGIEIDLLEPARMKALFLKHVVADLDLKNANVLRMRSEDLHGAGNTTSRYDWITARAVAPLPKLIDLARGLLVDNGTLLTLKGPHAEDEFDGKMPNDIEFEKHILTHSLLVRERAMVRLRFVSRETKPETP